MTGGQSLEDLELVFSGEARGAFTWLQCFVVDGKEWCAATGCPGKINFRNVEDLLSQTSMPCVLRSAGRTHDPNHPHGLAIGAIAATPFGAIRCSPGL